MTTKRQQRDEAPDQQAVDAAFRLGGVVAALRQVLVLEGRRRDILCPARVRVLRKRRWKAICSRPCLMCNDVGVISRESAQARIAWLEQFGPW